MSTGSKIPGSKSTFRWILVLHAIINIQQVNSPKIRLQYKSTATLHTIQYIPHNCNLLSE